MRTVLVTVMPYWAERLGVPRTVGVEFPYGHPLGRPGDRDTQMGVIREALRLLEEVSRNWTLVVAWRGRIDSGYLVYALPGHPEYRRYTTGDLVIVTSNDGTVAQ